MLKTLTTWEKWLVFATVAAALSSGIVTLVYQFGKGSSSTFTLTSADDKDMVVAEDLTSNKPFVVVDNARLGYHKGAGQAMFAAGIVALLAGVLLPLYLMYDYFKRTCVAAPVCEPNVVYDRVDVQETVIKEKA